MRCSKRELHIDDINRRYHIRNKNTLNEYCKNIIINDIEKMSSDEIKETILQHIKEKDYDNICSVKLLSENYRYFYHHKSDEFKLIKDDDYDRVSDKNIRYLNNLKIRYRTQINQMNDSRLMNNESSLFEQEIGLTDEELELVDILEDMSNTKYNYLFKKHKCSYKSIESEL